MSFFNPPSKPKSATTYASKYLKIKTGFPVVIYLMDEHPVEVFKHWITDGTGRRIGLRCPGREICPICARNNQINWNREHPDYIQLQKRYRVNVLELTMVKRCPACGTVFNTGAKMCTAEGCGTDLSAIPAEPLNEVKILERGPMLMRQFSSFESVEHFITGEEMALQSYPFMIVATGEGREMSITAIPQAPMDGVNLDEHEKFDLLAGAVLTPSEIEFLISGGAYKDVMAARSAASENSTAVAVEDSARNAPVETEQFPVNAAAVVSNQIPF